MLKRIIAFLITIIIVILFTSCNNDKNQPETNQVKQTTIITKNVLESLQNNNAAVNIDTSNATNGIIKVEYLKQLEGVRIYLLHNYESCAGYDVKDTSKDTIISLTNGLGDYYIEVVVNNGKTETIIANRWIKVDYIDEYEPYLHSTYAVYFTENMNVIKDAKKITEGVVCNEEKINLIKDFVIYNMEYSVDTEEKYLSWSYFPNVDEIYSKKKGVCTDFATMFAAICRSQNIPCKLITGYAGTQEELHVWVEVFNGEIWQKIDLTLEDAYTVYPESFIIKPEYYEVVTVD